ncbi:MAG: hypothetical protein MJZ46_02505 [Bacteroidales bacterium]|nr:hypothetical protein [Bacteroidales bacterium]
MQKYKNSSLTLLRFRWFLHTSGTSEWRQVIPMLGGMVRRHFAEAKQRTESLDKT